MSSEDVWFDKKYKFWVDGKPFTTNEPRLSVGYILSCVPWWTNFYERHLYVEGPQSDPRNKSMSDDTQITRVEYCVDLKNEPRFYTCPIGRFYISRSWQ